jgi:hypothetical protein
MVRSWDLAMVEKEMACASLCTWGGKAYARLHCSLLSWPPLLVLIWGARSRDPVQVGYRCMRTQIGLRLRVPILFLGCSM